MLLVLVFSPLGTIIGLVFMFDTIVANEAPVVIPCDGGQTNILVVCTIVVIVTGRTFPPLMRHLLHMASMSSSHALVSPLDSIQLDSCWMMSD